MKKVLLSAFEPFDGESVNPSLEAARVMEDVSFADAQLEIIELPVDRFQAIEIALNRLLIGEPDVVIMLGEAGRRFRINPERVAINVDDFRIPDHAGNQPKGDPIIAGAPAAYFSTLPIYAIVERIMKARIPAAISNTAGTYLCNRLFYSVMHFIAVEKLQTRAGFIHLPYLHEQTLAKPVDFPSLSRETVVEAVRLAIEASLENQPSP